MVTAGLSELLAGNQPITVFAVQNDAFDGAKNILAHLSPTGVENMLLAHVAFDTETTSFDFFDGMKITTRRGKSTRYVRKDGSNWKIENADGTSYANVIVADLVASNGVVHILDSVIMPPGITHITDALIMPPVTAPTPAQVAEEPEPETDPEFRTAVAATVSPGSSSSWQMQYMVNLMGDMPEPAEES